MQTPALTLYRLIYLILTTPEVGAVTLWDRTNMRTLRCSQCLSGCKPRQLESVLSASRFCCPEFRGWQMGHSFLLSSSWQRRPLSCCQALKAFGPGPREWSWTGPPAQVEMCRPCAVGGKADEMPEAAENRGHKCPSRTRMVLGHGCCGRWES